MTGVISRRRLGAAVLLAGLMAAPPGSAMAGPVAASTVSHYVVLSGDALGDARDGYETGCADGRGGAPGLRLLLFGTQERGDQLRPPGTSAASTVARAPLERVRAVAAAWIDGFSACRPDGVTATLALGVNNKSDGGADPEAAGAVWAELVAGVAGRNVGRLITVAGALDAEPSWSSPGWARGWVRAFTAGTPGALYMAGSADGCPRDGSAPGMCSNGWTVADIHYLATGAAGTVRAVPQIYRTDGVQARQWAWISSWGVRNNVGPLRVAAALSQHRACAQRSGCHATDNPPTAARDQLADALASDPATQMRSPIAATDMAWPERPPPE